MTLPRKLRPSGLWMSLDLVRLVEMVSRPYLTVSEKSILRLLANCALDDGSPGKFKPSFNTISKKTNISKRHVIRCLRALIVKAFITQKLSIKKFGNHGIASYFIQIDNLNHVLNRGDKKGGSDISANSQPSDPVDKYHDSVDKSQKLSTGVVTSCHQVVTSCHQVVTSCHHNNQTVAKPVLAFTRTLFAHASVCGQQADTEGALKESAAGQPGSREPGTAGESVAILSHDANVSSATPESPSLFFSNEHEEQEDMSLEAEMKYRKQADSILNRLTAQYRHRPPTTEQLLHLLRKHGFREVIKHIRQVLDAHPLPIENFSVALMLSWSPPPQDIGYPPLSPQAALQRLSRSYEAQGVPPSEADSGDPVTKAIAVEQQMDADKGREGHLIEMWKALTPHSQQEAIAWLQDNHDVLPLPVLLHPKAFAGLHEQSPPRITSVLLDFYFYPTGQREG
jgi:hypothetical protein